MTNVNRILTTGDFSTLSRLVDEWSSSGKWITTQARKILENAAVVFPADLPHDVASLGSRVAYTEKRQQTRTVELTALCLLERDFLPVRLPLGLALLGRREGEVFDVQQEDGSVQQVRLEEILEQPEKTWPGRYGNETTEADNGTAVTAEERAP